MRDLRALLRLLEERRAEPYGWGGNDCATFAAAAVEAQTGHNPLGGLRWKSAAAAAGVLKRYGGLEAMVSARLRPIPPALAKRGDIGAVACEPFGLSLAVVEGATLAAPGPGGLVRLPRAMMVKAWSADGHG